MHDALCIDELRISLPLQSAIDESVSTIHQERVQETYTRLPVHSVDLIVPN